MKTYKTLLGILAVSALMYSCKPQDRVTNEFIYVNYTPAGEPKVILDKKGNEKEVILPVSIVSAVGHAQFYNDEKFPRHVSIGGNGIKYFGEAEDTNADGLFEKISKRTCKGKFTKDTSTEYNLGELEQVLQKISEAIRAGKESINLKESINQ